MKKKTIEKKNNWEIIRTLLQNNRKKVESLREFREIAITSDQNLVKILKEFSISSRFVIFCRCKISVILSIFQPFVCIIALCGCRMIRGSGTLLVAISTENIKQYLNIQQTVMIESQKKRVYEMMLLLLWMCARGNGERKRMNENAKKRPNS